VKNYRVLPLCAGVILLLVGAVQLMVSQPRWLAVAFFSVAILAAGLNFWEARKT
jgi:hypothetical protein